VPENNVQSISQAVGNRNAFLPVTPFVGRKRELDEIHDRLSDPKCRLLTLTGPGGIGKTRLAFEAVRTLGRPFTGAAAFVDLEPAEGPDQLALLIADALKSPLSGQDDLQTQILNFLAGKEILLVLDNFEHLLNQADLLARILQAAPDVKLLVTSREALNLREEWLYPVDGMPYPLEGSEGDALQFSALELFTESARRVRPDFSLEAERQGVVEICRLVEGMPWLWNWRQPGPA
jgi:predicted ATPase